MNRLHAIIQRVHCASTHQRFAIDALPHLSTPAGKRLACWLLHHYPSFLKGAIDPDVRFCDHHNHLIHVRDGNWGGAPRVAQQWYNRLEKELRAERFDQAAHAAGVLSHYLTDVIQPLHTLSTEREGLIHQPFERSVWHAYDAIIARWERERYQVRMQLPTQSGWLGSLMIQSAKFAHVRAETLCHRFRFRDSLIDPRTGFDDRMIDCLAELFALAISVVAQVLDRSALQCEEDTGYPIPHCGTWLAMTEATFKTPFAYCKRWISANRQRRDNAALAKEYFRLGRLSEHLPAEVDIKRRVIQVRQQERMNRPRRRTAA